MLKFDKDKTLAWVQLFQLGKQNFTPKNKTKILLSKIIIFLTVIHVCGMYKKSQTTNILVPIKMDHRKSNCEIYSEPIRSHQIADH